MDLRFDRSDRAWNDRVQLLWRRPRPIEVEPVGEQTDRVSDMMEDMDLFSSEKKANKRK